LVEKFVERILDDARRKAAAAVEEARGETERRAAADRAEIAGEFRRKIEDVRGAAARRAEIETAGIRLERSRDVLAARNGAVERTIDDVRARFAAWIADHGREAAESLLRSLPAGPYVLRVPPDCPLETAVTERTPTAVVRDPAVRDGFVVEGARVTVPFTWEQIRRSVGPEMIEAAARELFGPDSDA